MLLSKVYFCLRFDLVVLVVQIMSFGVTVFHMLCYLVILTVFLKVVSLFHSSSSFTKQYRLLQV